MDKAELEALSSVITDAINDQLRPIIQRLDAQHKQIARLHLRMELAEKHLDPTRKNLTRV